MKLDRKNFVNWHVLLLRCCNKPLVRAWPELVRRESGVFVVRGKLIKRLLLVSLLLCFGVMGVAFPLFLWIVGPGRPEFMSPDIMPWDGAKRQIAPVLGPVVGLVSLVAGSYLLLQRDQLLVDGNRNIVRFRWGFAPYAQRLELPLNDLDLSLRETRQGDDVLSALVITSHEQGGDLLIATTKWRDQLLPIFSGLEPSFGKRAIDAQKSAATGSPNGEAVCRTPIRTVIDRGRNRRLSIDGDQAVLHGSLFPTLFLCTLSAAIAIFVFALDSSFGLAPVWINVAVGIMTGAIAVIGIAIWPRKVIVRRDNWLRLPQCAVDGRLKDRLHATDILAVQLCTVRGQGEHVPVIGFNLPNYDSYQVNLVARRPAGCRINLICDTDRRRAADAAKKLAALLAVPLLDHRETCT